MRSKEEVLEGLALMRKILAIYSRNLDGHLSAHVLALNTVDILEWTLGHDNNFTEILKRFKEIKEDK